MVSYNLPEKFREEFNNLSSYSRSSKFRKSWLDKYIFSMGMYFLNGDYEHRKKAVYAKKKIIEN